MEEEDSKLSLLASIFDYNDDKTEKVAENNNDEEEGNEVNVQRRFDRLKEALRLANGDIEAAVDWLLKKKYKRPSDSSLDPPCIKKHQKHQTNLEHFGIISTSSRINKESLNAKRMSILEQAEVIPENNAFTKLLKNSASSSSIINLTAETVSKHLPAKLILNFFGNSDDLLVEVLKDSLDWKPPKFIIFDQLHTSSHLTAIYSRGGLEAKKEIRADHYEGGGGGGGSTLSGNEEMQTFGPLLENARRITEDFINSYRRQQESYEIHPDETQGPWIASKQSSFSR